MTPASVAILIVGIIAILSVSRNKVPVILMAACCFMTVGQTFSLFGANMPFFRCLIIAGIMRLLARGEFKGVQLHVVDKLMISASCWTFVASFFHEKEAGSGPIYVIGGMINVLGTYFILRRCVQNKEDLSLLFRYLALILVPVAVGMAVEKIAHTNVFAPLGGIPSTPAIRDGKIRAQGPFSHPILAGTIGSICFPMLLSLWHTHRTRCFIGLGACLTIVVCSASSGPILSLGFAIFALIMWRYRQYCRRLIWASIIAYPIIGLFYSRPVYYLMSEINITGASSSWHRSFLIEQTINHFSEWWLYGTDYTRHWMPSQGAISERHTDITNQYIASGVNGGILSVIILVSILFRASFRVGRACRDHTRFVQSAAVWGVGAAIFSNAASSMSVAYFGQAQVFFWLPVALAASAAADPAPTLPNRPSSSP